MCFNNLLLMFTNHYFTRLPTWVEPGIQFPWHYTPSDIASANVIITSNRQIDETKHNAKTIICTTPTCTSNDNYMYTIQDDFYKLHLHGHEIVLHKDTCFGRLIRQNVRTHVAFLYHIVTIIKHNMSFDPMFDFNDDYVLKDISHSYNNTPLPQNKRFALLFYGLPNVFQVTAPFLKAEWIDPLNCDVYLTTENVADVDLHDIYALYNVKGHVLVSQQDDLDQDIIWDSNKVRYDVNDHRSHLRQFTKIKKGKTIIDTECYDYVIVMRFDNFMIRPPCMQTLQSDCIYTKMTFFYIIPSNLFQDFCNVSDYVYTHNISRIPKRHTPDGPPHDFSEPLPEYAWLYSPENQCYNHIDKLTDGKWYAHIIAFVCICRKQGTMDIFL